MEAELGNSVFRPSPYPHQDQYSTIYYVLGFNLHPCLKKNNGTSGGRGCLGRCIICPPRRFAVHPQSKTKLLCSLRFARPKSLYSSCSMFPWRTDHIITRSGCLALRLPLACNLLPFGMVVAPSHFWAWIRIALVFTLGVSLSSRD